MLRGVWLAPAGWPRTAPWKSLARTQACCVGNQDAKKTRETEAQSGEQSMIKISKEALATPRLSKRTQKSKQGPL